MGRAAGGWLAVLDVNRCGRIDPGIRRNGPNHSLRAAGGGECPVVAGAIIALTDTTWFARVGGLPVNRHAGRRAVVDAAQQPPSIRPRRRHQLLIIPPCNAPATAA